jgi:diacylglycerol kinase (ATP)
MATEGDAPNPHKQVGLKRLMDATVYSVEGFGSALKHESAFRMEAIFAVVMLPTAALLPVGLIGSALMMGSVLLVLITELMNSALEWVVDYISLDAHPYAKRAKDMASAAVFISLFNTILIWALVIAENWEAVRGVFS